MQSVGVEHIVGRCKALNPSKVDGAQQNDNLLMSTEAFLEGGGEVKTSSPIRTSFYEREGSMWGSLKWPSPRHLTEVEGG